MPAYTVAITGASGAPYANRLLAFLLGKGYRVYLTISEAGMLVVKDELGWEIPGEEEEAALYLRERFKNCKGELFYYHSRRLTAPIASGTVPVAGMFVVPCSMSTAAAIATGRHDNLIGRAADVTLKEGRTLVVVPRETPFNEVHLRNLLRLVRMGVKVVPAMPAFYNRPRSVEDMVDFVVGRALDQMGIVHDLYRPWQEDWKSINGGGKRDERAFCRE
ncbi:MAG: flavin prenyltransferase [Eubacteriales bacterium]|nr:flavin prenyltransferase [Eubacteriales bacterium]